jgi:hypothetical protein
MSQVVDLKKEIFIIKGEMENEIQENDHRAKE